MVYGFSKLMTLVELSKVTSTNGVKEYHYEGLIKYGNFKFKIIVNNSDGTPCDSDYKHCIKVLTTNGTWEFVEDSSVIASKLNFSKYDPESVQKSNKDEFVVACKRYIELIYG